eukprot:GFYU01034543.1.p1 GENE.GFYU01034543.1~~GFYU01034543.1.p1  ORF type:complete len:489 (-),score=115.43 GFYU01034543.1:153-1412(-)
MCKYITQRLLTSATGEDDSDEEPLLKVNKKQKNVKSLKHSAEAKRSRDQELSVVFLDTDVGQPEFTPAGLVSLNVLTSTRDLDHLLSAPHTHMSRPTVSYFVGDTTPKSNPELYLSCVVKAMQYYQTHLAHQGVPLVVNTCGWIKGYGLEIIHSIVQATKPTHFIQLLSQDEKPISLSSWPGVDKAAVTSLTVPALTNTVIKGHMSAVKSSQVQLASYMLSHHDAAMTMIQSHRSDTTDMIALKAHADKVVSLAAHTICYDTPFVVPWANVKIRIANGIVPSCELLRALNGALVGLCHQPYQEDASAPTYQRGGGSLDSHADAAVAGTSGSANALECVGLGIVRTIDPVARTFYVVTPVPLSDLEQVNVLVKGTMDIPIPLTYQGYGGDLYVSCDNVKGDKTGSTVMKSRNNLARGGRK